MKKLGYSRVELVMPSSLKQKAIEFGKQDERPLTWVIIKALEAYLQNKGIHRIVDRFETLNMLDDATKTGRDQEWGQAPAELSMGLSWSDKPARCLLLNDRVIGSYGAGYAYLLGVILGRPKERDDAKQLLWDAAVEWLSTPPPVER